MKTFKIHFMTIWYYSYNTNKQIDLGSFKLNINLIFFSPAWTVYCDAHFLLCGRLYPTPLF